MGGFLNLTLAVHPTAQTYLIVKLYGSDQQAGVLHVFLRLSPFPSNLSAYPELVDVGRGLLQLGLYDAEAGEQGAAVAPLNLIDGRPLRASTPRRFCFATTALPRSITSGASSINLLLGGYAAVSNASDEAVSSQPAIVALRPMYRVYKYTHAAFVPIHPPVNPVQAANLTFDLTTQPPPLPSPLPRLSSTFQPITSQQLQSNLTCLQRDMDASLDVLLQDQAYGAEWQTSNVPAVLYGAPAIPRHLRPNNSLTPDQWLREAQFYSTGSTNSPLPLLAVLAVAYSSPQSAHFPGSDLLQLLGLMLADFAAASLLNSPPPVPYSTVQSMLNSSLGYAGQVQHPEDGPFFTQSGWVMECRGVEGGGGVDFSHSLQDLHELVDLSVAATSMGIDSAGAYLSRTETLADHLLRFAYPALIDDRPYPEPLLHSALHFPTDINTRTEHSPAEAVSSKPIACWYLASTRRTPLCLRLIHVALLTNRWPSVDPATSAPSSAHPLDTLRLWTYAAHFVDVVGHLYDASMLTTALLPSEVAYLDVVSRVNATLAPHMSGHTTELNVQSSSLQIKYQYEQLLVNFNRRHARAQFTGYAQLHWQTPQYSVEATVAIEAPDGFSGLFCPQFAPEDAAVDDQP